MRNSSISPSEMPREKYKEPSIKKELNAFTRTTPRMNISTSFLDS
jgi:hypothetical protein